MEMAVKSRKKWRVAGLVMAAGGLWVGTLHAQTSSPVHDDLFAGTEKFATGASDVTEVDMDPDTLRMVGGHDAERAHGMVLNVVKTYEYPKPGMYNIADVEAIRARLNTGDWHCTVHTRDLKSGESTDICYKRRTDNLAEKAIITVEPKELTFIHQIQREGGGDSQMRLPNLGMDWGSMAEPQMAALNPAMQANMAVVEARMAALGPEIAAKTAAIGPLVEARMAAMQPEMEAGIARAMQHSRDGLGWQMTLPVPPVPPLPAMPAVPPPPAPGAQ